MADMKVVQAYTTRAEAEMAQARLESEKITSLLNSEDAGGMIPTDLSVEVLVAKKDFKKASKILANG